MSKTRNIDDLINGITPSEVQPKETESQPEAVEEIQSDEGETLATTEEREDAAEGKEEAKPKIVESDPEQVAAKESEETDEYGNDVPKARMYTEEDVQRMIRDRLSRGQQATPQQQQQVQQAAQNFTPDPNSADPWESQLKEFVKTTIDEMQRETQTKAYQQKELQKQTEFEAKFTTGMEKYKDFRQAVADLPITDSMMMATRDMKDPAAFIYAAAKRHGEDIKRIAGLTDPFQQATEIGRLEERMKKAARISQASKPLSQTKGDVSQPMKEKPKYNIDHMIQQHAKTRMR